jgi:hypothetical protein
VNGRPTITVPGSQTVQYSDPLSFGISATDPEKDAITLGASGLPSALGLTDNGNGTGTVAGTVQVVPGTYPASFSANDGHNPPVTAGLDIFVSREDCTLTYGGDILVPALANTKLAADLGEPDLSLGDRSGKLITFTVTDSAGNVQTLNAITDASGRAQASVPLAADVYAVSASFAGDVFYMPCQTLPPDAIVTVTAAAAKVTGGGWISAQSRTNFGFNLIPQAGGLFKTQFQLRARNNKSTFHATVVNSVTQSASNSVSWSGTGTWLNQTGCAYQITVVDRGSSRSKKTDTIAITITCGATVVYSTSGPQPLKGGNITVH